MFAQLVFTSILHSSLRKNGVCSDLTSQLLESLHFGQETCQFWIERMLLEEMAKSSVKYINTSITPILKVSKSSTIKPSFVLRHQRHLWKCNCKGVKHQATSYKPFVKELDPGWTCPDAEVPLPVADHPLPECSTISLLLPTLFSHPVFSSLFSSDRTYF